ncbi:MAG: CHASE2 domain-containing protein [Xanthobacteraceae bacterium]
MANIAIGLVIAVVMETWPDNRFVVASKDWALDTAMRIASAYGEAPGKSTPSLTLIDIDEETWRNPLWGGGEPLRAPRDGLWRLIKFALDHKARYLVVDVLIENPPDPEDRQFIQEIENVASRLDVARDQHILFVRSLRHPLDASGLLASELRPSPLDAIIDRHISLLNVAPYFRVSRDGLLREWQLWRVGCQRDDTNGNGRWLVLPSVQLAIAVLRSNRSADLQTAIRDKPESPPAKCVVDIAALTGTIPSAGAVERKMQHWLRDRRDLTGTAELNFSDADQNDLTNRIFFKFSYPVKHPDIQLISAGRILAGRIDGVDANLSGGVVVIGQSFEDARDEHATALGAMPGAMVLINSIDSMLDLRFLHPPSEFYRIVLEAASIIAIGYAMARFDSFIATTVILVSFLPLLGCAIYILLRASIWYDLSVPILGIFLHRTVEGLLKFVDGRSQTAKGEH